MQGETGDTASYILYASHSIRLSSVNHETFYSMIAMANEAQRMKVAWTRIAGLCAPSSSTDKRLIPFLFQVRRRPHLRAAHCRAHRAERVAPAALGGRLLLVHLREHDVPRAARARAQARARHHHQVVEQQGQRVQVGDRRAINMAGQGMEESSKKRTVSVSTNCLSRLGKNPAFLFTTYKAATLKIFE